MICAEANVVAHVQLRNRFAPAYRRGIEDRHGDKSRLVIISMDMRQKYRDRTPVVQKR